MYTRGGDSISQRVFHIRLGKDDDDLQQILEAKQGRERSSYIKNAIRFYEQFGQEISTISTGIKNILSWLDKGDLTVTKGGQEQQEKCNVSDDEEIIIDSIQDLLNL